MEKIVVGTAFVLLFSFAAAAQDTPRMETFLGYTFTRANSSTNVPSFNTNGGGGQFVYNVNSWLGAVADIGATHNGNISGVNIDNTMINFLVGPRVPFRFWSRITPYVQVLFGGVYYTGSTAIQVPTPAAGGLPATFINSRDNSDFVILRAARAETAFAMIAGGGLDIKINRYITIRPIGLDYFMTRLQNLRTNNDNNQNNLRYTAGINFTFGEAQ